MLYQQGQGVPQDFALAVSWWQRAAEQGLADAQNFLGVMYDNAGAPRTEVKRSPGTAGPPNRGILPRRTTWA